jgi:hypothetical protein
VTHPTANLTTNAQPKLGVDVCDCCGRPPSIVGPINTRNDVPGYCAWCAHDLDRYEVLAAELEPIVRDWIAACRDREITVSMMREVFNMVEDRVFGQEFATA